MSIEYSSRLKSTVYVHRYSLSPKSPVYVPRVQFMSPEYSLSNRSTVYVIRVQFMSLEYSLCL